MNDEEESVSPSGARATSGLLFVSLRIGPQVVCLHTIDTIRCGEVGFMFDIQQTFDSLLLSSIQYQTNSTTVNGIKKVHMQHTIHPTSTPLSLSGLQA